MQMLLNLLKHLQTTSTHKNSSLVILFKTHNIIIKLTTVYILLWNYCLNKRRKTYSLLMARCQLSWESSWVIRNVTVYDGGLFHQIVISRTSFVSMYVWKLYISIATHLSNLLQFGVYQFYGFWNDWHLKKFFKIYKLTLRTTVQNNGFYRGPFFNFHFHSLSQSVFMF